MPWPVAGASTITTSYFGALLDAAVELRQLPDLADGHQLAKARRRSGEVGEDPVLEHQVVDGLHLDLQQQVLLERALGIDREREEVGCDLGLVVADPLALEEARHPLLLRDLADDRPLALARGGHPERGRDGRFADAALAGEEDDALVEDGRNAKAARSWSARVRRLRNPLALPAVAVRGFPEPALPSASPPPEWKVREGIVAVDANTRGQWVYSRDLPVPSSARTKRAPSRLGPNTSGDAVHESEAVSQEAAVDRDTQPSNDAEPEARPTAAAPEPQLSQPEAAALRASGAARPAARRAGGQARRGDRVRQPEGRRREDHDDPEPGRRVRREGPSRAGRRHRPAGQPHDEPGDRPRLGREVDVRRARPRHLDPRGDPQAGDRRRLRLDRPRRRRDRDEHQDRPRALAREGAQAGARGLRLRVHRHAAVARTFDDQRPDRRRPRLLCRSSANTCRCAG